MAAIRCPSLSLVVQTGSQALLNPEGLSETSTFRDRLMTEWQALQVTALNTTGMSDHAELFSHVFEVLKSLIEQSRTHDQLILEAAATIRGMKADRKKETGQASKTRITESKGASTLKVFT